MKVLVSAFLLLNILNSTALAQNVLGQYYIPYSNDAQTGIYSPEQLFIFKPDGIIEIRVNHNNALEVVQAAYSISGNQVTIQNEITYIGKCPNGETFVSIGGTATFNLTETGVTFTIDQQTFSFTAATPDQIQRMMAMPLCPRP